MKSDYQYAFRDNAKGVSEVDKVYISKSDQFEHYLFDRYVIPYVQKIKIKEVLVDIGSGEGRYSEYFGKDFKKVIALEPDEQRYANSFKNLKHLQNTECIHGTVNDVPKNIIADVIINIHVLQHVHSSAVDEILNYTTSQLKIGGLFILAITKKTDIDEPWNIAWQEGKKALYSAVPETIFEYITVKNIPGILPVRKVGLEEIEVELKNRGFKIEHSIEYAPHLEKKPSIIEKIFMFFYRHFPPSIYNSIKELPGHPRYADVLLIARKIS